MGKKKRTISKAKEPVRIRLKELKNGNRSIYLDIYRNGKRVYDFPKLYLVPEKTDTDKEHNREMLAIVNQIKAQKILEIANNENGLIAIGLKQKSNFIDYVKSLADKKQIRGIRGIYGSYMSLTKHLISFRGEKLTFKHITKEYCSSFIEYLKTAANGTFKPGISATYPSGLLSAGSQYNYCRILSVILNCAVEDGILQNNPMKTLTRFERPKQPAVQREYLTIEEVNKMKNTQCIKPMVKMAFLFTCFSGLRFSDIKALKWGDIHTDDEGKKLIRYTQQKTRKHEYLQVSDEILKFLPDRGFAKDDDVIFILSTNTNTNYALQSWALAAGITKRVTFHVGRHTNATLLLSRGAPIETVSKLLGHNDIKTTQIYAKIIDKNKRAAASLLDGLTD